MCGLVNLPPAPNQDSYRISEAIYLQSQGFDKQIIKEEFWDSIKGLFGQHGSEAIFGTFKEYMGKWLLKKLFNKSRFEMS